MKVEKAAIKAFYYDMGKLNYSIGEFKLYASDSREELFESKNEVVHECGKDRWFYGARNNADWVYDVDGSFRYFGIKVLNSNPTDDITRIGYIGLYNSDYSQSFQYLSENYPKNIFAGQQPNAITDNCVFDDDTTVTIDGEQTFTFDTCGYDGLSKKFGLSEQATWRLKPQDLPRRLLMIFQKGEKEYIFLKMRELQLRTVALKLPYAARES